MYKAIQVTIQDAADGAYAVLSIPGAGEQYRTRTYSHQEVSPLGYNPSDYDAVDSRRYLNMLARRAAESDANDWATANGYTVATF